MENISKGTWVCSTRWSEGLYEKVAFKQIADGNEGVKHMDTWKKSWLCDL